jgi:PEP-CTERM motif-containing protein
MKAMQARSIRLFSVLPAICLLGALTTPARASTAFFTSPTNTFYVGTEDSASGGCDCDYNDLLFSLSSTGASGLGLNAIYGSAADLQSGATAPTLGTGPAATLNGGSPFWNTLSGDSTYANFGECLYETGIHNTCNSNGTAGGTAFDNTAKYLVGAGAVKAGPPNAGDAGGSVDFYFSETVATAVTFTLLESIAGTPANDETALYACPQGGAVNSGGRANCIHISLVSGSATLTAANMTTLGLSFDLLFFTNGGSGGFGPYDSNTTVTGNTDLAIDHFAVAVGEPLGSATPEPATLVLVGGGLLAAGLFRRRKRGGPAA